MNENEIENNELPEKISWRVFPAKANPGKTTGVAVFLAALHVLIFIIYGLFWTLFALIVFFLALNSYFFPSDYFLDSEGILIDRGFYKNRRKWNEFRRLIHAKNGVVLSPFSKKTFLDNFRGIHLLLPKEREPILEFINRKLQKSQ
jgi:hypothetical protein